MDSFILNSIPDSQKASEKALISEAGEGAAFKIQKITKDGKGESLTS